MEAHPTEHIYKVINRAASWLWFFSSKFSLEYLQFLFEFVSLLFFYFLYNFVSVGVRKAMHNQNWAKLFKGSCNEGKLCSVETDWGEIGPESYNLFLCYLFKVWYSLTQQKINHSKSGHFDFGLWELFKPFFCPSIIYPSSIIEHEVLYFSGLKINRY